MKVKSDNCNLRTSGKLHPPGAVVEVTAKAGKRLIASGNFVEVKPKPKAKPKPKE